MITDNLPQALAELRRMADPEALATDTLEGAVDAMIDHDRQPGIGGWKSRSGELIDSYEAGDVTQSGDTYSVEEVNTADHAEAVEARDGLSVMTAADSGAWEGMLQSAFDAAKRRQEKAATGPAGTTSPARAQR